MAAVGRAFGMDVFETGPLPDDDVLRTLPNVLATPPTWAV